MEEIAIAGHERVCLRREREANEVFVIGVAAPAPGLGRVVHHGARSQPRDVGVHLCQIEARLLPRERLRHLVEQEWGDDQFVASLQGEPDEARRYA